MTTNTQLPLEAVDARMMWDWHVELIEALARERRDAWEIIMRHGPLNHDRIYAEHTVRLIDRVTKAAHADSLLWAVTQRLEKESH